jgi:hypothetical protein
MGLPPLKPLSTDTVEVGGVQVEFRSLSRAESLKMRSFVGDPDAAEIYILAAATGSSEDEARKWREGVNLTDGGALIDAILIHSGLATRTDGVAAPLVPSNGSSEPS